MPEVVDWKEENPRQSVARAAQHLAQGLPLLLPTESSYELAANALIPEAVVALDRWLHPSEYLAVALSQVAEVADWLPALPGLGHRLVRRNWPGPLTVVADAGVRRGLAQNLPHEVRERLLRPGGLALRQPAHEAPSAILKCLGLPLVMAPLHPPIFAVRDVPAVADGWLVLADDSQHTGQLPTVVRIAGKQNRIEREGAVTASALEEKSPCRILFVCTGNTCRSPMAEALCRRLLADRLGCEPAQLPRHGFAVESAGLAALAGDEPSPEAIQAVRHYGADLSEHRSRPLTPDLLADADFVLAMTRTHLQFLVGWDVGVGPRRPRLLSSRGEDIDDPIGGTLEVYHACARQIVDHLQELLAELLEAQ